MTRSVRLAVLTLISTLALLDTASAQSLGRWGGFYGGVDLSTSFGIPDFTVDFDATPGHSGSLTSGSVKSGVTVGGRIGLNWQIGNAFVVGGEFGVGKLGYHGTANLGDWLGETEGGTYFSGIARVGYGFRYVMPYASFGVWSAENTAHVLRCAEPACLTIQGEGSNTVSTTRSIVGLGAEFAPGRRAAGFAWSFRIEWLHIGGDQVLNSFVETIPTGPGSPRPGFPVEVTSQLPPGMLRFLVDIVIKR